jgi:hypothetical protein
MLWNNLIPHKKFNILLTKKINSFFYSKKIKLNFIAIYQTTLIRFVEYISGKKILLHFNPFVSQSLSKLWVIRYKLWIPRLSFYERKLGHRFFLEESIHIMHLSYSLKDTKLFLTWLKIMILRISF